MIQSKWPFSHSDLDSGNLIYLQTDFHLVVVMIHLWLLLFLIIAKRHLAQKLKCPLHFILFNSNSFRWLIFLSVELRHFQGAVIFCSQRGFCISHSMWTCITLHSVHKAAESRGSEALWCSRDSWCLPDSATATNIQNINLFARAASKHSPLSNTQGFGLIIQQVLSNSVVILCKRVESELMDDLITGDWMYRSSWSYSHCLSGHWGWRRIPFLTGWNHHIQETLIEITLI